MSNRTDDPKIPIYNKNPGLMQGLAEDSSETESSQDLESQTSTGSTDIPKNLPKNNKDRKSMKRNKYADIMNKSKKTINKKVKITIYIVLLCAVIGGVVYAVNGILKSKKNQIGGMDTPQTAFAITGDLETFVSGYGSVSPKQKAELGKSTKGKVLEVNFDSGDIVKAGDIIFKVDPSQAQKDLDDAMSDIDQARTSLNKANKDISSLSIGSPFKGKIIAVEEGLKVGNMLSIGSPVCTIVDDSAMLLDLYFSYAYVDILSVGMSANVSIPSSMTNVSGKVSSVEKIKRVSSDGTISFKATIKVSNPGTLTKDMIATALITGPDGDIVPTESSKLKYLREEQVVSRIAGEIKTLKAVDYQSYNSGDVLCVLENDSLFDAVNSAKRSIETSSKKIEDLKKSVAESSVISPIDGILTTLIVSVGDEISGSGTAVAIVSNLTTMVVDIDIDEMDISKVSTGMPVTLTTDSSDTPLVGEVASVSFQAKTEQNGGGIAFFPAQIIVENVDNLLMPGMGVNYKITSQKSENTITVPTSAVVYIQDGRSALYVRDDSSNYTEVIDSPEGTDVPDEFILVPVEIGISDSSNTEIVSGISDGIEVYLVGPSLPNYEDGKGMGATMVG